MPPSAAPGRAARSRCSAARCVPARRGAPRTAEQNAGRPATKPGDGASSGRGAPGEALRAPPAPRRCPARTHLLPPFAALRGALRADGGRSSGSGGRRRSVASRRGRGLRAAVAAELGAQLQVAAEGEDVQSQREGEEAEEQAPAPGAGTGAAAAGRLPPVLRTHGRGTERRRLRYCSMLSRGATGRRGQSGRGRPTATPGGGERSGAGTAGGTERGGGGEWAGGGEGGGRCGPRGERGGKGKGEWEGKWGKRRGKWKGRGKGNRERKWKGDREMGKGKR